MASSMDAENDEFVLAVLHFVWFQLLLPAIVCLGFQVGSSMLAICLLMSS